MAVVLWTGSILRAIVGVLHREPIGRELSLAFVLVVSIPWLVRRVVTRA